MTLCSNYTRFGLSVIFTLNSSFYYLQIMCLVSCTTLLSVNCQFEPRTFERTQRSAIRHLRKHVFDSKVPASNNVREVESLRYKNSCNSKKKTYTKRTLTRTCIFPPNSLPKLRSEHSVTVTSKKSSLTENRSIRDISNDVVSPFESTRYFPRCVTIALSVEY